MRLITLSLILLLGLGAASPARAADPLEQLVRILGTASDYKQRLTAVLGLARLNDPRAVPALCAALGDSNNTVRGTAANVLGKLGGPRAEAALEALLPKETDDFVIGQAQTALAALIRRGADGGAAGDGLKVAGTRGTLDREAVQNGIDARMPHASACFERQFQKAPYLGGRISLLVRVALGGKVQKVRIGNSDLGSRSVEQCILDVVRAGNYGKPDGGEAEFTVPLSFGGETPPPMLDPERSLAAKRLRRSCKKLLVPGQLLPPNLQLTMYVDGEGGVADVGLSASGTEIAAPLADGLIERLKAINLGPRPEGVGKLVYPFFCESR